MKLPSPAFRILALCLCILPIDALAQSPGGAASGLPPVSNAPAPDWTTSAVVASAVAAGIALGLVAHTSSNH